MPLVTHLIQLNILSYFVCAETTYLLLASHGTAKQAVSLTSTSRRF